MDWIKSISKWNTLFELKEDHEELGLKGWVFFVSDFAKDLKTGKLKYIITAPIFTGLGVGTGSASYVLEDIELIQLFIPIKKTFKEYAQELEDCYFKEEVTVYYCESCDEKFSVNKDMEVICCPYCKNQDIKELYMGSHSRI
ncbi:hypothetical protein [Bacillus mycoides]|uniref:Uncharacterized protein n=1 Tax=Bacillus mycoides TaxID=1405 RepID=A0ABC9QVA8_BACMY|nr:hypothetical protein [Bacillus mycoides]EJR29160.1 hypothetical protein III_05965 [Bacillus mycoides]